METGEEEEVGEKGFEVKGTLCDVSPPLGSGGGVRRGGGEHTALSPDEAKRTSTEEPLGLMAHHADVDMECEEAECEGNEQE